MYGPPKKRYQDTEKGKRVERIAEIGKTKT